MTDPIESFDCYYSDYFDELNYIGPTESLDFWISYDLDRDFVKFREPIDSLGYLLSIIFSLIWIDVIESLDLWLSVECELNLRDPTDP